MKAAANKSPMSEERHDRDFRFLLWELADESITKTACK